jgi:hypothetical protein
MSLFSWDFLVVVGIRNASEACSSVIVQLVREDWNRAQANPSDTELKGAGHVARELAPAGRVGAV